MSEVAAAQLTKEETVEIKSGTKLMVESPYAQLIRITPWDKQEVNIKSNVLINQGMNDDAFQMKISSNSEGVRVETGIKNIKSLPETIQIRYQGQNYYFNTSDWNDPKVQQFLKEKGRENMDWISHGVSRDIRLEIRIPENISVEVNSKFGIIEIVSFEGEIYANSIHGGVDVSFDESARNRLELHTKWGEIYTNLDLNYENLSETGYSSEERKNLIASLNDGTGSLMQLGSKHGNIYLRKIE